MTNNLKYGQNDRRLIIQKSLIIVSLVLLLGVIVWYLIKEFEILSDTETKDKTTESIPTDFTGKLNDIAILDGFYNGIRESMDGSIEAVLMKVSVINKSDNSFNYVLNIGTNKRYTGIGSFDTSLSIMKADMIGDLSYSINGNGKILLITSDSTSNTKYELIKE